MVYQKKGFTVVELLFVIGIIGILSLISVASIQTVRAKARDTKRAADIRDIQTALMFYVEAKTIYPKGEENLSPILGKREGAASILCDTDKGFQTNKQGCSQVFMEPVPGDPLSKEESQYEYSYTPTDDFHSYTIDFKIESGVTGLKAGLHTAAPNGIQ